MTRPPADMPRDYSDHADLMAALSAENDIDVQAAIRAAVDKYGVLPDQVTAASLLAIDTYGHWNRAGKPVLEDRDLYEALWAYADAIDHSDAGWIESLDELARLAAEGRYYSQGGRNDDLLAALATSRRLAAASDEILLAAVQSARDAGRSWDFIGEALGIARQNAYRRYAHRLRTPVKTKRA
ncbi:hypothetical protein LK459_09890 [Gordonia otitidis]|uniref:hypothetical protein n=1 Tax=Gordonia otitidis TaxID=249058 RepID=UPI001D139C63|nr:hypothetical protein [Gordonia otitidis]UEA61094.1 hypothetical protein LK459_09890 [Gordonia otitidis]